MQLHTMRLFRTEPSVHPKAAYTAACAGPGPTYFRLVASQSSSSVRLA
jgi:hypothetical protein